MHGHLLGAVGAGFLTLAVAGCSGQAATPGGSEGEDSGGGAGVGTGCPEPLDWDHVGHPAMLTWCTACHSQTVEGEARAGAPEGLDLDHVEGVRGSLARVEARIAEGTMPPGGGMPEAEQACLLRWLAEGAPGTGAALEILSVPEPSGVLAWELSERVEADSEPDAILLESELLGIGHDTQTGPWSTERWITAGDAAGLSARIRYGASGEILFEDRWEPPLALFPDSGVVVTLRTRWTPSGTEIISETWDVTVAWATDVDPRSNDPAPLRAHAVERSSGREVGADLSQTTAFTARWFVGFDPTAEVIELQQVDPLYVENPPGFPVQSGQEWTARLLGTVP